MESVLVAQAYAAIRGLLLHWCLLFVQVSSRRQRRAGDLACVFFVVAGWSIRIACGAVSWAWCLLFRQRYSSLAALSLPDWAHAWGSCFLWVALKGWLGGGWSSLACRCTSADYTFCITSDCSISLPACHGS